MQDGVVGVPGVLPPTIDDGLGVGVVRCQSGDGPTHRVIQGRCPHPDQDRKLEPMSRAEEWLEGLDRMTLVVEDGPAATYPAIDHGTSF